MYNRYIPDSGLGRWADDPPEDGWQEEKSGSEGLLKGLLDKTGLAGLTKHLRLSKLDAGDVLVLVIAALLILDKEDIDLGIALILVFLLGVGEQDDPP